MSPRSYRRDFWNQQPVRVEVWSEKGTVRGVLQPVLDHLAVGFRVMHGFSSGTVVHNIAEDDDGRELIALYVGDFDPSGMFMSEEDLPKRLAEYGGRPYHVAAHRADCGLSCAACRRSRSPTRRTTRAATGSSPTMANAAGSWTRWTRTICAIASNGRSRS